MKKSFLIAFLMLMTAIFAQAQDITVNGTVLSNTDGEPLIGATVMCVQTKTGTATDFDGNFTLKVPDGSTLTISYIGYSSVDVKAQPELTFLMK